MQRFRPTAFIAAIAMMAILSAPALGAPQITVEFAKRIEKRLDAIDRIERIREERFRRTLVDEPSPFQTIQGPLNQEFRDVRWAGEMLVPDLESFGMRPLITAMVAHNLARAVPDFDGSVRLEIKRLKVRDHSVAYLRSENSYVTGEIEVRDASGSLIFSDKLTANFVLDPSVDSNYRGPKLAFAETDEDDRIGPTLAYFVERALERVWPDKKDEIVGPTIIRLTGPNETILR
ncbi:MAG: hypothetical protein Kow00104_19560 [Rhodothalassiaceae bacterium]